MNNCCNSGSRAYLRRWDNNVDVNGITEVAGDEWWWLLTIFGTELTGATLKFTAKCSIDDPDTSAKIALSGNSGVLVPSTGIAPGISCLDTSSDSRIDAMIVIPAATTRNIVPFTSADCEKMTLIYDVELTRITHLTSPEIQTYFRPQNHRFHVTKGVTNP